MPQLQLSKPAAPDFIPAGPDFIPANGASTPQSNAPDPATAGNSSYLNLGDDWQGIKNLAKQTPLGVVGALRHPVDTVKSLYNGTVSEGKEAVSAAKQGSYGAAAAHAVQAVPIVGSLMKSAGDDMNVSPIGDNGQRDDSYGAGLKNLLSSPKSMGTLAGGAATLALPAAKGIAKIGGGSALTSVADTATAPIRAIGDAIPTRAKAGAMFESLNKDLATQPVRLKSAAAPLQRATEIGTRGGNLPASVSALLQRSQAIEPMTFPEARDYQGSLSDLSASDKLAMNGRMRGGVAQLNKGLYGDIYDAANEAGRGADYAKAMRDYRIASTVRNGMTTAAKYAIPAVAGGGLLAHYLTKLVP